MRSIRVNASKEYKVLIGAGVLDRAGEYISAAVTGGRGARGTGARGTGAGGSGSASAHNGAAAYENTAAASAAAAVVTDDIVSGLYLDRLRASLHGAGYRTTVYTMKNGEASKNAKTYISLLEHLAGENIARSDVVVALGGGVVGDLAGFAAATYMRGVPFVQIPTTLLSAVDSSVGGKTAIDLESGKNLVGAFYQPNIVLCDASIIGELPPRIFTEGCAEIIKYGMIADAELLEMIGDARRTADLEGIIARCVTIKRDMVCEDEFDFGVRRLLNFGHTFGHAVEKLSGYKISHGGAVSVGMAIISKAAARMKICDAECYNDLTALLHKQGLPYTTRFSAAELARAALSDKKRRGGKLTLIVPKRIGKCVTLDVKVEDLESIIRLGLENE